MSSQIRTPPHERVVRPMSKLREDSLVPILLVTATALLVAAFATKQSYRVPATSLPTGCPDGELALRACELPLTVRVADFASRENEIADCSLHAANQPGVSYVNDIERVGRTDRVVAQAAGPFRSQLGELGSLETRNAAREMDALGCGLPESRIAGR
jgi:hypothetical protein